eukprot:1145103-Karenia_brevis.AAC.1
MQPTDSKVEHMFAEMNVTISRDLHEVKWIPTHGKWDYVTLSCRDTCEGMTLSQHADLHVSYPCTAVSNLQKIQQE